MQCWTHWSSLSMSSILEIKYLDGEIWTAFSTAMMIFWRSATVNGFWGSRSLLALPRAIRTFSFWAIMS